MIKIYIGCSLTHAPQDFLALVDKVKSELKKEYEVLEFLGLSKGTSEDVYKQDIQRNIVQCDMFVAICDHPSIGLGYEMAAALEKYSKPTIALAKEGSQISRLALGINHPMYTFKYYKDFAEILSLIKEKEQKHFKSNPISEASNTEVCDVCTV